MFGTAIGAVLALVINLGAMGRAARDVLDNPVRGEIEREAALRKEPLAPSVIAVLEAGTPAS